MKIALLATAAAAIALSGTAAVVSSSAALADTVNTSVYRPFGTKVHRTDRVREYQARRAYLREHTYVPVYTPPPAVRRAADHLSDVRDRVHADGRVTLFEKIKLKAAENRYNAAVRSYR